MSAHSACYWRMTRTGGQSDDPVATDWGHPNAEGARVVAATWLKAIARGSCEGACANGVMGDRHRRADADCSADAAAGGRGS